LFYVGYADAQQTKSPQIVKVFESVVAKPSQSVVRVLVNDKEVALGTVVAADGWIITKHSELKTGKIAIRMANGLEFDAELIGFDVPHDLALLRVPARGMIPVVFTDSKEAKIGHWVASPGTGKEPVAIGVVSVAAREIKGAKFLPTKGSGGGGYLGITFDVTFAGVKVESVLPKTPAEKAGLKIGDQILNLNGTKVDDTDVCRALLSNLKPGDDVKLQILRDESEKEIKATLGTPPGAIGGKPRSDKQNNMGSKLSERRAGFPIILQHDSVVKPQDCGGPLVNLEGKVLGINISRAGRVESYAIPSEAVRPLVEKLKMKKLEKSPEPDKTSK
jgi:serine protease Do